MTVNGQTHPAGGMARVLSAALCALFCRFCCMLPRVFYQPQISTGACACSMLKVPPQRTASTGRVMKVGRSMQSVLIADPSCFGSEAESVSNPGRTLLMLRSRAHQSGISSSP
eukprot:COSAG01_NODE_32374_length_582_cov_2.666667_1_plen_112_part_10